MRASLCSRLQDVFSGAVGWYRGLRDLQPQGNDNIPVPDPSFIRVATLDGPFTTLHLRALHCPMGLPTHCHSHHCCCGKDKTKAHRCSVGCQATFSLVSRGERMTQTGFWVLERIGDGKSRWVTRDASVLCGDQATKSREDSELGTHPTEGRAQHPQSSGSPAALTPLCPLSWPTPTSSLLSDPEKDSTDADSVGRSHPAPVMHFHLHLLGFLSPLSISASSQRFPFPCFDDAHPGGPRLRQALRLCIGTAA